MIGKLERELNVSDIAHKHGMDTELLREELVKGIQMENEHSSISPHQARILAMDHLYHMPDYYSRLNDVEGLDNHMKYAKGGPIFTFNTPTGRPSKLTYLQQVLVRTQGFKKFFGDWEMSARAFLTDNRQNFQEHYKGVSYIIDIETLEPKLVFHGTQADEFFEFDVSANKGRPYAYFAYNREYSGNFMVPNIVQQNIGLLYECFVSVHNPFWANSNDYIDKQKNADYWTKVISETLCYHKYNNLDNINLNKTRKVVESQIGQYIQDKIVGDEPFWYLMANDMNKEFRRFLVTHGFDGIVYYEELSKNSDITLIDEFTQAVVIFNPEQVKLADGRNLDFDPQQQDIRFKDGGETEKENADESYSSNVIDARRKLDSIIAGKFAEGGEVVAKNKVNPNDGKKGGYFNGRSHATGGIKAVNKDTGQMIEVEGKEVIINKNSVSDPTLHEFEGKMLTNKEILSKINQRGGGVAFAEGGQVCGCGN